MFLKYSKEKPHTDLNDFDLNECSCGYKIITEEQSARLKFFIYRKNKNVILCFSSKLHLNSIQLDLFTRNTPAANRNQTGGDSAISFQEMLKYKTSSTHLASWILRIFVAFSLQFTCSYSSHNLKSLLQGKRNFITLYNYWEVVESRKEGISLLSWVRSSKLWGNGLKLCRVGHVEEFLHGGGGQA